MKKDILIREVTKRMLLSRIEWWKRIHVVELVAENPWPSQPQFNWVQGLGELSNKYTLGRVSHQYSTFSHSPFYILHLTLNPMVTFFMKNFLDMTNEVEAQTHKF